MNHSFFLAMSVLHNNFISIHIVIIQLSMKQPFIQDLRRSEILFEGIARATFFLSNPSKTHSLHYITLKGETNSPQGITNYQIKRYSTVGASNCPMRLDLWQY